jgi:cytochrome c553
MKNLILLLCFLSGSIALPAAAESMETAKALYDENCVRCHGTEVYTREDRKITSLEGLERQVRRCELALGLKWFDDEITEVTNYLNEHYYHFEP